MAVTKITKLPPAPQRSDPDNFPSKGDALMSALDPMVTEVNAAIDGINAAQTDVSNKATLAQSAADTAKSASDTALAASGAAAWVSGRTYALNAVAISQVNFQAYRKRTATAGGTVDPASNNTDWRIIASGSNTFVPVVVTGNSIDLRLGSYFIKNVTENITLSIDNCPPDGVSFVVELVVTAGSVAFAQASAIKTSYDRPITLGVGKTHELMFITSNGGVRYKLAVGESFTT